MILVLFFWFGILEFCARLLFPGITVSSGIYELEQERRFTLKPNAITSHAYEIKNGSWRKVSVVTSSQGLRDHFYDPKAHGEFRILLLGDSFTFGWGLTIEKSIPRILEGLMNSHDLTKRVTVINGGVPGYAPWQERLLMHDKFTLLEPDLVILQIFLQNDIDNTLFRVGKRTHAFQEAWHLELRNFEWQTLWQVSFDRWLRRHLYSYNTAINRINPNWGIPAVWNSIRALPPLQIPELPKSKDRPFFAEIYLRNWYPELKEG